MSPQVWLITGASSGFGLAVTEYVISKGDIAVAGVRNPSSLDSIRSKYPSSKLAIVKLDVTKASDIAAAFAEAKKHFGGVDVVFNNAGVSIVGEVEATPEADARNLFDINFWGADRVSREAVRFFREENKPGVGGRLLVNTSYVGIKAEGGVPYYSATKFALEGITQAFAAELDPEWNIKITLVEPGAFLTKALTSNATLPIPAAYNKPTLSSYQLRNWWINAPASAADPDKAAAKFYELTKLQNPPLRFVIGKDAIQFVKGQLENVKGDVEKYESWSDNLDFD